MNAEEEQKWKNRKKVYKSRTRKHIRETESLEELYEIKNKIAARRNGDAL